METKKFPFTYLPKWKESIYNSIIESVTRYITKIDEEYGECI